MGRVKKESGQNSRCHKPERKTNWEADFFSSIPHDSLSFYPHPLSLPHTQSRLQVLWEMEISHSSLWHPVIINTNWYKCEERNKNNISLIVKSFIIIAVLPQIYPQSTSVEEKKCSITKCLKNSELNKIEKFCPQPVLFQSSYCAYLHSGSSRGYNFVKYFPNAFDLRNFFCKQ